MPNGWVSHCISRVVKLLRFTGSDWMLTDYVVENGSYAALRNLSLGYTLNPKVSKRMKLNGLRVYAAGENLYYVMAGSYRGINPKPG